MSEFLLAPKPVDMSRLVINPLFRSKNRLKLASFAWNQTGGNNPTMGEGPVRKLDWAQQVRFAQLSEAAGFDAIISVAQWRGWPGPSRYWDESYEPLTWAAGLAGYTRDIAIFSTVHVPIIHPVRLAKSAVTIDHASGGRFGLNIVAGWNQRDFSMFGHQLPPHDDRYGETEEWLAFVQKLWTCGETFDWNGKYFQAKDAYGGPLPLAQRVPLMNAGASAAGQAFAAKNVDMMFIPGFGDLEPIRETIRSIKAQAAANGREIQVWTTGGIMCRPTEAEAQRQFNYFVQEKGDWEAADAYADALGSSALRDMDRQTLREGVVAWTFSHRLIGTPEQVVEKMSALADAGLDGLVVNFFDIEDGLQNYRRDIRPLAQKAGLVA